MAHSDDGQERKRTHDLTVQDIPSHRQWAWRSLEKAPPVTPSEADFDPGEQFEPNVEVVMPKRRKTTPKKKATAKKKGTKKAAPKKRAK
jgi:hypothetical protein